MSELTATFLPTASHTRLSSPATPTFSYRHGPVSVWESAGRSGSATSGGYREWRALLSQQVSRREYRLADGKEPRPVREVNRVRAVLPDGWLCSPAIKCPIVLVILGRLCGCYEPPGPSRPVRGGALAARAAWLGSQGPRGSGSYAASAGTIWHEGAHRALRCAHVTRHRRVRPPTRHAKLPFRNLQGSPGRSARAAGGQGGRCAPRAAARRERVRVRQMARGARSSLATVARLIPALAASCSWDRPCWRRNCRNRWPSRAMFQR